MNAPRLEAFKVHPDVPVLVPSTADRAWMDAFPDRHAYRCLPLSIANAHCWELLVPAALEVSWNGGPSVSDLTIQPLEDWPAGLPLDHFVRSNFSRGIVTFHTGYIFRTPLGWNLLATGPFNEPRHGIYPLTGIIETDWLPYPFTMNWQMLSPGTVRFEKDEVFCSIFPIPKGYLDKWEVAIHDTADDPVLEAEHETFRQERVAFMKRFDAKDPDAMKQAWQRHYFVGRHPDGTRVEAHANKLRLAEPQNRTGMRPLYARETTASAMAAEILAAGKHVTPRLPSIQTEVAGSSSRQLDGAGQTRSQGEAAANARPTPWQHDSILNRLDQNQNERNHAGRGRIDKGILRSSPETVSVTSDLDTGKFDFIYAPHFLDPTDCAILSDTARTLSDRQHVDGIADPYWKGRILFIGDVDAAAPRAAELMRHTQRRITERLQQFYALTAPVYADTVQLVQWREGMFMQPHADRANPDGTEHGMAHRDFAGLVYLNEDYEGGELYFPRLDLVLKPTIGMLVAFTGGWHHEHAVLKVTRGLRLTMPAFYTLDEAKKDRTFYIE